MENAMIINLSLLFGLLVFLSIYRYLKRHSKNTVSYEQIYNKIINSEEYQVKGQYEE